MSKLVSIVTPVYNQKKYLERTVDSVLNQTYPNIQYIIVDDGSTDGSDEIIKTYEGLLKSITTENRGQAAALNLGWSLCTGHYFSYLSADDLINPYCIEKLVSELEARPNAACVFPNCDLISSNDQILKKSVCKPFNHEELLIKQECYIGPGALWRSNLHQKVGGWNESLKLAPDREFWLRLSTVGSIDFITETLAYYRLHDESISYRTVSEEVSKEYLRVLDNYFTNLDRTADIKTKNQSYAYAKLLICRNMLRGGKYGRALHYLWSAWRLDQRSLSAKNLYMILRSAFGKPVRLFLGKILKSGWSK